MNNSVLLTRMHDRVVSDKEDGDVAYYHALCIQLEYLTKLATAGVVACLGDDADRQRYGLEHQLVRANSIGDWVNVLNATLTGPAAQLFYSSARTTIRDFTQRVSSGDWRYLAVEKLYQAAKLSGIDTQIGAKVQLRQFFENSVSLRNRTRGHGAITPSRCSLLSPLIQDAVVQLTEHLQLFRLPWAYLHRNLSGKYRVSRLSGDTSVFDYLKKTRDMKLHNGVYLYLDQPIRVPLLFSDAELLDVYLPNGNFKAKWFEVLSYLTDDTKPQEGANWTDPRGRLPSSETEGPPVLEQVGNVFANLPPKLGGYISRPTLENDLLKELQQTDRHPIVSMTGSGGIGKTSTAIAVLHQLATLNHSPYEVVLWMSARDIDLLETGPKPVKPRVLTRKDIARVAVDLLEPSERVKDGFDSEAYFAQCLTAGAAGTTLFVIDNFETVEDPADLFGWLDTYIRPPNKVLITTRFREFVGDYPIEIRGMVDDEALKLIGQEARRLKIDDLMGAEYKEELIRESDGHPYVIKILLGQVEKEGRVVKPRRIVASADHILTALFERTYANLDPAAQRVFLLLSSWRVLVPSVAVEAVILRPDNERLDVKGALDQLHRFSLVDEVVSEADSMIFVGVPLAASMFGRSKLGVSLMKAAVEDDRRLLIEFGAGKREDVRRGVYPRVERLVHKIARDSSGDPTIMGKNLPILEYLASSVPKAYLKLAELVLESGGDESTVEQAKAYLKDFLQRSEDPVQNRDIWLWLADLCRSTDDSSGEVHALSEAVLLPTTGPEKIADIANRLNRRIRALKGQKIEEAWSPEMRTLIQRVIVAMEKHLSALSATECSRLAWLLLNIGDPERAEKIVNIGISQDPTNEHCQKLKNRLNS